MIKESIQQEDIISVNPQLSSNGAPNSVKTLPDLEAEKGSNTVIVKDFSNPLSSMDRSSSDQNQKSINIRVQTPCKYT